MAAPASQQYAFRAQKSMGLVGGSPEYEPIEGFQAPSVAARIYQYSPDGRLFAVALPSSVQIFQAESAEMLHELPLPNIVELNFSPRGTYLSTWERHAKLEDGAQHRNLRVFSVSTGEELIAFTQKALEGWDLQYTIHESHAIRLVGPEIHVYNPADWTKGTVDRLRVDGASSVTLSPGLNPSVAVFIPEKKGQPAHVKIYSLLSLSAPPTCQKTFFKAEKSQIKWNTLGTQVLVLTQTDVDATNKSYYGATGLYLLSAAGNFDCRVALDKEGPIHDFAWSPNSKEFGVVYGYMPAKAMLFDQRVRSLHDFGTSFSNFISFNPQSRLILLGGFGNLAGKIDLYDRRSLQKFTTIDASNTSYCEWSPDGKFILTATLSPRLRVDNGIKVWYILGQLMHVQTCDELYQAGWRPALVDSVPAFPAAIPPAPAPSASAQALAASLKPAASKPAGAYRPPGARGQLASVVYSREEGGPSPGRSPGGSGAATPTRQGRSPAPHTNGRRYVPGAPTSPSPGPDPDRGGKARKRKPNKEAKEPREPRERREGGAGLEVQTNGNASANGKRNENGNGHAPPQVVLEPPPLTPVLDVNPLDPVAKKVRNLNKKVRQACGRCACVRRWTDEPRFGTL
ncbi:eukaryotic translation initiation factor eIF2A-domain-containing protein [Amylostereum chailletii]|nr:eukaryotic translation initiation factor eIF2A-domain-containing protein [Amylostereum chailletii]